MNIVRRFAVLVVALSASPALADDASPVTHTDQLVVVTPNPPVVITNGAPSVQQPGGPSAAPVVAAPVAANGAPHNEDWNNVSHINGSLIKVGEKTDYLLRSKTTNVSTNPIGWLLGFYGVSVSHALSNNVAVRFDANLVSVDGMEGYEIGASLPIYFRKVYSGPFLEPGLIARGTRSTYDYGYDCYECSGSMNSMDHFVGPEVLFGWHWMFDSGLNVAAAFGAARPIGTSGNDDEYDYSDDDDVQPAGYFRIGYAF